MSNKPNSLIATFHPKKPVDIGSPCGSGIVYRADLSFAENGRKVAKIGQKLDLNAMIQAALPSTDIAAIVARVKMGDDSVLHVNPGFVGDATALPKDLYDYKAFDELYAKVSGSFATLPDEVKALFNNDPNQYLNDIISNKAEKILNDYKASQNVTETPSEGDAQ